MFWDKCGNHLRTTLDRFYTSSSFTTLWPQDVENFFILPRLLPPKNKASIEVFKKVVDKIIVFKMVSKVFECFKFVKNIAN